MATIAEQYEAIQQHCEPLMRKKMDALAVALRLAGLDVSELDDLVTDEEFVMSAWINGNPNVDVSFYLTDSAVREGEPERPEEWEGCGILLSIVEEGGRIVADYAPMNYTPEVWTRDLAELERRIDFPIADVIEAIQRKD